MINYKSKINLLFVSIFIACSILWITAISPISPVYFCAICILMICIFSNTSRFKISYSSQFAYFLQSLFAIYLTICPILNTTSVHNALVLSFTSLFFVFSDFILKFAKKKDLNRILNLLINVSIIYFGIDFIYRFHVMQNMKVPTWIAANPIFSFYLLKFGGIYAGDSNSIGIIILTIITILYLLYQERTIEITKIRFFKTKLMIIFVFLILTCSRASILSFFVFLFFYHFVYKRNIYSRFLTILSALILFIILSSILMRDPSFQTKIDIYIKTFQWINNANFYELLFGVGANNSSFVLGRYAHNPISIYLIEYGAIGLILYLNMFLGILIATGKYGFLFLIAYIPASLSYTPIQITYIYMALAFIKKYIEETKQKYLYIL